MIVITTQNFPPELGGAQLFLGGIAGALAAAGEEVYVLADTTRDAAAAAQYDGAQSFRIRRFGGPRFMRQMLKRGEIKRLCRTGRVRAVITDNWKRMAPLPAALRRQTRLICLALGNEFLFEPESAKGAVIRRALAKADIVAAISAFTAQITQPFIGAGTKLCVVCPGVAPPDGAQQGALRPPRKPGPPRLLSVSRLEPRKGIDKVLAVLPGLIEKHPGLTYQIAGGGDDAPRLKALAAELGVAHAVTFLGPVSMAERSRLLQEADIFVHPNRREPGSVEGFGIVFLEAAAFGMPAIAGSDGGTADAVVDGKTGLIVPGEDEAALSAAIERLLLDAPLREAMGLAAAERFWAEFAWPQAVRRFLDLIPPARAR